MTLVASGSRALRWAFLLLAAAPLLASPWAGALPVGSPLAAPEADSAPAAPPSGLPLTPVNSGPAAPDRAAWLDALPLERVAARARAEVAAAGGALAPPPDAVPGYDALPEEGKRVAWRAWMSRAAIDHATHPLGVGLAGRSYASAAANGDSGRPEGLPAELAKSKGFRALWALEQHGWPIEVLTADPEGATFLVTSRGVLRFASPDGAPEWMVKPGWPEAWATTDANGDGARDIVLSVYSFDDDQNALIVLDGTTGATLSRAFTGDHALWAWQLTDADGDGKLDVLGLDARGRMVAAHLDGTEIWSAEIPSLPSQSLSQGYVWVALIYFPLEGLVLGDVTGDGALDFVLGSDYLFLAFVFPLIFQDGSVPLLSAFDGTDGTLLWRRGPTTTTLDSYLYAVDAADLDGDGREDVIAGESAYVDLVPLPVPAYGYLYAYGVTVFSGEDGSVIVDDKARGVDAYPVPSVEPPVGGIDYEPFMAADLDQDGLEEIVGVVFDWESYFDEDSSLVVDLVGRVPGPTAGGPSVESWRTTIDLGSMEGGGGDVLRLRDVDGDGLRELVLLLLSFDLDSKDEIQEASSRVLIITSEGARTIEPPRLLGNYDVDEATGQAYGWAIEGDRWLPLDAAGAGTAPGLRIVLSLSPLATQDHSGDGVPDLLLAKTMGLLWIDGRTGKLLADVPRPLGREARQAVEEEGRLRVLEESWTSGTWYFVDVETGAQAWKLTQEDVDYTWWLDLEDADGDGLHEVVLSSYEFDCGEDDCWLTETLRFMRPRDREVLWEREVEGGSLFVDDFLVSRAGVEVLETPGGDGGPLALHAPGAEEPLWTRQVDAWTWLETAADGYFVLSEATDDDQSLQAYSAADGAPALRLALPDDSEEEFEGARLVGLDSDAVPELLVQWTTEDDANRAVFHAMVGNATLPSFALTPSRTRSFEWDGEVYEYSMAPYFVDAVGDRDGDGRNELAFSEWSILTLRSGADGRILAVAPGEGYLVEQVDLNGDGAKEFFVATPSGRLRLLAEGEGDGPVDPDDPLAVLTAVDGPVGGDEAFFGKGGKGEKELLPSPGVALGLAALAAALLLRGRNRRI